MAKVWIIWSWFWWISAAIHAASQWHEVTVYEKNEQLWWRASVFEKDWFRRDMWPSWYLMPDLFDSYFEQFWKNREDYISISKLAPSYKIFFKDTEHVVDVFDELEKNRETFERLEPGSTDKLYEYLELAKYQYEVAMKEFVPRNYDSIFDFFTWRMATEWRKMRVFEKMDKYVKRWFKTPEMQKIMQYPLVFLWTAPKAAPALYNIMTYVDFWMGVFYPDGWVNSIIQWLVRLAKEYWVVFYTNSEVTKINVENWITQSITIWWEEIPYDYVISNADYHWTETQMLEEKRQTFPQSYWDKKVMAPSWFILYLGVKWHVENLDHHTLVFSKDRDQNFKEIFDTKVSPTDPSLYICCPSKTDKTVAPPNHENLFILVPFPPGVELDEEQKIAYRNKTLSMIEESIWETFQDRIVQERVFTVQDFKERYNSFQWSALGLAHTMRQTALLRPNTKSKKVKNLFYAGWYTNPGIGMPMCLISGKLAVDRIKE